MKQKKYIVPKSSFTVVESQNIFLAGSDSQPKIQVNTNEYAKEDEMM